MSGSNTTFIVTKEAAKPGERQAPPKIVIPAVQKAPRTVVPQSPSPQIPSSMQADEMERLRAENARLVTALRSLQDHNTAHGAPQPQQTPESAPAQDDDVFSFVVLGASGDLAHKKIFPSIFRLKANGWLPPKVSVVGYARTNITQAQFRERVCSTKDGSRVPDFCSTSYYVSGAYDSVDDFKRLSAELDKLEKGLGAGENGRRVHRLFYMALPPSVFIPAAKALRLGAMSPSGHTYVVVEKPFGRDLESSRVLQRELGELFKEEQIFRIDHYLGKEMVQNMSVLRFANVWLKPLWNHENISSVIITFKEEIGTEGRAGYFDSYGIIRDIMQNHQLQILAAIAMEPPVTLSEEDVRDEKVKVLRAIPPINPKDVVIGQFAGYLMEPGVPKDSVTPTFAAAKLYINNPRWTGVPFILRCGKALNERKAEIRVQFHTPTNYLYPAAAPNELVIRVQPNEAIYLKIMNKEPGMSTELVQTELDLTLHSRFGCVPDCMPDAYEHLIRDVFRGDHSLFVRSDELDAAWRIFTPLLHELEENRVKPIIYEKGTRGPPEGDRLMSESGFRFASADYKWPISPSGASPRNGSVSPRSAPTSPKTEASPPAGLPLPPAVL